MTESYKTQLAVPQIIRAGPVIYGYTHGAGSVNMLMAGLTRHLGKSVFQDVFQLTQKHTSRMVTATPSYHKTVADGFILENAGTLGIIRTADCTPLFFWDESGKAAGLVHVGWRGLAGGIVGNFLEMVEQKGFIRSHLHIWLGPAIEGKCYPVGPELRDYFPGSSPQFWGFLPSECGRWHLDVGMGIINALVAAGVPEHRIQNSGLCTFCEKLLPSYRRQGPDCGRILNFIMRIP